MTSRLPVHPAFLGLLLTVVSSAFLHAQIAYTCPEVPPDPNLAKVAFFRVLYVGGVKAPNVCLVREPQAQPAAMMEPHLRRGTYSAYFPMRPSRLTLHILDQSVVSDPAKPLPLDDKTLKEKKLTEPVKGVFPAGGYRTLLVHEREGKLTSSFLEDTRPLPGAPPVMRVIDLSGLPGMSVNLCTTKNKFISTLWKTGAPADKISLAASGVYYLIVAMQTKIGISQISTFECELNKGTAFSVILLPGKGNRGDALFTFDGALGNSYDAETIKTFADSAGAPQPL